MIQDKRLSINEGYLLYLEEVPKHKFACKAVKISEDKGKRWRNEDQDFADLCEAKVAVWVMKTLKRTKPEFQLERLLREDFAQRAELTGNEGRVLPVPIMGGPLADPVIYAECQDFINKKVV